MADFKENERCLGAISCESVDTLLSSTSTRFLLNEILQEMRLKLPLPYELAHSGIKPTVCCCSECLSGFKSDAYGNIQKA